MFDGTVSQQSKFDVLNSKLLAQLAATKKFNRETQIINWYKYYRTVLENVGYVVDAFGFSKYNASGRKFTMDRAVIDVLKSLTSNDKLDILKSGINALKALDDGDGRLVLFEKSTHNLERGNFQVSVASEKDGFVSLDLGAFHFKSKKKVKKILWFGSSKSDVSFSAKAQSVTLNPQVYSQVREAIVKKLGKKAKSFIKQIEI